MAVYIDYQYYSTDYYGTAVTAAEFPQYERRAEDIIDALTRYVIKSNGLSSFPALTQELVKKAVAAQIDYYGINGIDVASAGITSPGFTVGKVSVNGSTWTGKKSMVSPEASMYLEQTGLMNREVSVRSSQFLGGYYPGLW